ncbi:hypothetical protein CVT24_010696 [Panaeolus cyanescens]|uniref:HNH nuclease domain-containing protein n=1 Tax=Panaeolus cyanescens TaxID=181874 RepID=A0A409YM81_9AGAR|nr:hypothetical protein CVT24_010696 [Panaeolus cyanescens]
MIDALEWTWGMKRGTLNLDTHRNIFSLGPSMYSLYREKKWGLLPTEEDVYKFYDKKRSMTCRRDTFAVSEPRDEVYTYRLIPLRDMEEIYITRQSSTESSTVEIHEFPFEGFPTIRSHVHPKFVILHLGLTIEGDLDRLTRAALFKKYPYLWDVQNLSLAWTAQIPQGAFDDPTYVLPRSEIDNCTPSTPSECNDDTAHTPPRRIIPLPKRHHFRPLSSASSSSSSEASEGDDWELAAQGVQIQNNRTSERTSSSVRGSRGCHNDEQTRPLTSLELSRQEGCEDSRSARWDADRIVGWAKRCRSPTPPPSPTKPVLRRSTRIRKKPKRFLN